MPGSGRALNDASWYQSLSCLIGPVLLFLLLLLGCLLLSITLGASELSWQQIMNLFTTQESDHVERVVWQLRLPRALLAAMIGIHFALSGFILQTLTRNPLADAGILGISAGASFSAVLAILGASLFVRGLEPHRQSQMILGYLPLLATAGGVAAAGLIYRLSGAARLTPLRLILTGVVLATILNALVTGALALWGHSQTEMIVEWLAGSLHGRDWQHLAVLWPWTLIGLTACILLLRPLNLLRLEDEQVLSIGLNLRVWRLIALITATLLAASAVGVAGPIGFMGLVVPYICRRLSPHDVQQQMLLCVAVGALLMMLADLLGRIIIVPYELPVGVVCALIGVPFFLYLLRRQP
ncbi:FecCD family ABC transporter permease [Alkalimarinus coralli]|uniref:FecCD family ABC transporter permease n=1 Tax=Alkalimarinus coralli TaxID=2935863 RepID=UPI00202AF05E|nr:iron ABC transporter permease [Alkalimarinus coralli]